MGSYLMSRYKNQSFRTRLGFALQGLAHGVRAERSLQAQLLAFAAALAALGILRPGALWWALVLLASAAVIAAEDRKSTRLNSSHTAISYAVFCLKKKKQSKTQHN